MGFFTWLTGSGSAKSKQPASTQMDVHSSFMGHDATRPYVRPSQMHALDAPRNPTTAAVLASRSEQRKAERNSRRDLLFQVVRESMVRVGILSSAFRFKVLALDQRGRVFLVMIDLSAEFGGQTDKLAQIEALIAQSAKTRFDLIVQAVYWRFTEIVSSTATRTVPPTSAPAPLSGIPLSRPAPLSAQPIRMPAPATMARSRLPSKSVDPIDQTEVEAFKRALASGAASTPVSKAKPAAQSTPAASASAAQAAAKAAIKNKLLLTGYEDTEIVDPDEPAPALSATQYGEFR